MRQDTTWYRGRSGPGDIVLDGDPAPPKGAQPSPIFGPSLLWQNDWMDQLDFIWRGGRPRPRRHCVRWDPAPPAPQNGARPPIFGPYLLWSNGRPSQLLMSSCSQFFGHFGHKSTTALSITVTLTHSSNLRKLFSDLFPKLHENPISACKLIVFTNKQKSKRTAVNISTFIKRSGCKTRAHGLC